MNLFKIWQTVNQTYDTYDSAIVCAETAEEARWIYPGEYVEKWDGKDDGRGCWCNVEDVQEEIIGDARDEIKKGVVLASFNAG
jgi:hypothetical protein